MTSYRIAKIEEFNNAIFYRALCPCGSSKHDYTIWLEYNKEINDITMNIYKKMYWKEYFKDYSLLTRIFKRIKGSIVLLFGGYLEMESDILFTNSKQIEDFIGALKEGMDKLNKEGKKSMRSS